MHLGRGAHPRCPVTGDGGLICTQIDGSQAQCVARLLYITSALFFSLLLSDPVQVPQQWPDAQNTHGTQRYTSIGAFMRIFTFEYMHIHYSCRGSLGCVTGTVWREVKSAVGVLQTAEESCGLNSRPDNLDALGLHLKGRWMH